MVVTVDAAGTGADGGSGVIDPDVDLRDPAQVLEVRERHWDVVGAIAAGGLLGAEARYGLGLLVPHHPGEFPWATLSINASGCVLIGVLMVFLLELITPHRLARPFLGVGILGGYTTFSTFAMDAQQLLLAHRAVLALVYVAATVVVCGFAVWASTQVTRAVGQRYRSRRSVGSS